ncbi:MAG: hypothetical protein BMS9Abin02_0414 [Anaerolineae bacterium]|nr:MAG: hypothetical protein BMS9Abin02_0414 [Anaerolineae bacterium]
MVPIRNKVFFLLVGMFTAAWLLVACSPEVTVKDSPSTIAPPAQRSEPQPSRTLPEPTEPSLPLTNTPLSSTPSPPNTSESALVFCDKPPDGLALSKTPSQQEGLSAEIDSLIPPAPPAFVNSSLSEDGALVTWAGTGTDVDQFYNVYRLGQEQDCWEFIGMAPVEGDNQGVYTFDTMITDKQTTEIFGVTTVDIYGNESDLTIAVSEPGS